MIDGVLTKNLKVLPDERGRLMEILRCDETGLFRKFGQIYVTTTYPGVVKGWHYHNVQIDNFVCLAGMVKLVLYDSREESKTRGEINEFCIGEHSPLLVQVPARVFHGWKCISVAESIVLNVPTEPYRYDAPDEVRVDPHVNDIPYSWARKDR